MEDTSVSFARRQQGEQAVGWLFAFNIPLALCRRLSLALPLLL